MSFLDPDFPADERSIHEVTRKGVTYKGTAVNDVVAWRRLKDLQCFQLATDGKQHVRLFQDGIEAADIHQGQLGNCGLLSALACLATRPGGVEELFLTPEYNEEGRYQLRLWDRARKQFREITIDDRIPVWKESGVPCFARPNGNEAWVLLLEKAVAKWAGGYHQLRGGHASWWLQALTGHYTCVFALGSKYGPNRTAGDDRTAWRWMRQELGDKVGALSYREDDPNKFFSQEEMFMAAEYHLSIGNLVAAASEGASDTCHLEGVVRNHAYTVLAARLVAARDPQGGGQERALMVVQVRNPHGSGGREWTGDWSDASPLWEQHPEVAAALGYVPPSAAAPGTPTDGCFWMCWPDFTRHFHNLIFCCAKGFDYMDDADDEGTGSPRVFKDSAFPHDHTSLGPNFKLALAAGRALAGPELDSSGSVVWLRLRDLAAEETFRRGARGLKLFAGGGTHPDDIDGGSGGLMVAAACLANRPGVVEELFLSGSEYRPDGEYQLRLYDPAGIMAAAAAAAAAAVTSGSPAAAAAGAAAGAQGVSGSAGAQLVTIDDWIPCFGAGFTAAGRPLTGTRILGAEVWVLLLEKAVAKFVGSYRKLRDCLVPWALAALSGQYTCMLTWQADKQKWRREELVFKPGEPGSCGRKWAAGDAALVGSDQLFGTFSTQLLLGCAIAAETDREDVATDATGLARARYYSVLDARVVRAGDEEVRLVKLRDPARTHEWKGDWSDTSALWDSHPEVAAELEFQREAAAAAAVAAAAAEGPARNGGSGGGDGGGGGAASAGTAVVAALPGSWDSVRRDGAFWMPWQDFLTHFKKVAACGNSLRGAPRPWEASEEELQRAARKLQRLRAALRKRAEQEALEESRHQEVRRKALERLQQAGNGSSNGSSNGHSNGSSNCNSDGSGKGSANGSSNGQSNGHSNGGSSTNTSNGSAAHKPVAVAAPVAAAAAATPATTAAAPKGTATGSSAAASDATNKTAAAAAPAVPPAAPAAPPATAATAAATAAAAVAAKPASGPGLMSLVATAAATISKAAAPAPPGAPAAAAVSATSVKAEGQVGSSGGGGGSGSGSGMSTSGVVLAASAAAGVAVAAVAACVLALARRR